MIILLVSLSLIGFILAQCPSSIETNCSAVYDTCIAAASNSTECECLKEQTTCLTADQACIDSGYTLWQTECPRALNCTSACDSFLAPRDANEDPAADPFPGCDATEWAACKTECPDGAKLCKCPPGEKRQTICRGSEPGLGPGALAGIVLGSLLYCLLYMILGGCIWKNLPDDDGDNDRSKRGGSRRRSRKNSQHRSQRSQRSLRGGGGYSKAGEDLDYL